MTEEIVTVLHVGERGCGQVAFHLTRRPKPGDPVNPAEAVLLDGSQPVTGDPVACGTCGLVMFVATDAHLVGGYA